MDKTLLQAIRKDLDEALNNIAQKHGLATFKQAARMTYDADAGTFGVRVEGLVRGGKGADATRYELTRTYEPHLPPLGGTLTLNGRTFTITGETRGGKICIADAAGKPYTCKREALDRQYPEPLDGERDNMVDYANCVVDPPARIPGKVRG